MNENDKLDKDAKIFLGMLVSICAFALGVIAWAIPPQILQYIILAGIALLWVLALISIRKS